jgi:predicted DCC family thiol-disulfide oxidoreductase YuxK
LQIQVILEEKVIFMDHANPILLYDGSCGFCQNSVQFILRNERTEEIYFAPLQSDFAEQIKKDHPEILTIDSIIFLKGKDLLIESNAALELASYLKAPYYFAKYVRLVPKGLRDSVYRLLAKNRHRLIRNSNSCLLPSKEQRNRFLS